MLGVYTGMVSQISTWLLLYMCPVCLNFNDDFYRFNVDFTLNSTKFLYAPLLGFKEYYLGSGD